MGFFYKLLLLVVVLAAYSSVNGLPLSSEENSDFTPELKKPRIQRQSGACMNQCNRDQDCRVGRCQSTGCGNVCRITTNGGNNNNNNNRPSYQYQNHQYMNQYQNQYQNQNRRPYYSQYNQNRIQG